MRKKNKSIFLFMFLCILIMGIGYAFLTSTLTINGVGAFSKNSWLIYFNDIREKPGSAAASTPAYITNPEATHIEFDVDLNEPGDFYDFDVYIKNDGTIDAMIDEVTITGLTAEQKQYMNFIYTYTDGTKIRKCDKLPAKSFKDTHLRVEYLEDANLEIMPENGTTHFDVTITYVQDGSCTPDPEETITVTVDPDGGTYNGTTELTTVELSDGETYTLLTPERTDYTFKGWVEVTNTNSYSDNVITANGQDVRVKATWESNIADVNTIILTIDPNGGIYNESTNVTTVDLEEGNTYTLLTPTREGYRLTGWEEITETNSLSNGVVTAGTENVRVKAIWEEVAHDTITLTINPDGGTYDGDTTVELETGEAYTIHEVIKDGFNLVRWEEVTNTNSLTNGIVTAGIEDITIKAIWEEEIDEDDRVAKIIRNEEDKFYTSIQNAINDAVDGETIYLLKNTSEEFTNNKNVTLDLGGFKVTGSGTNEEEHNLTIINGSIENPDGVGFTNNGSLTLGINDDKLCPLYVENPNCAYKNGFVSILGTTKGLLQNGTFNFYDGFVEGEIAISGSVTSTPVYEVIQENPKYYFVLVNHDSIRDDQKAYLAISSGDAVSMTTQGGLFYYVDLSDNFKSSAIDGKRIYLVRNFEGAYELDVPQGVTINMDLAGWNASIGSNINNNGTLNIIDDGVTKGSLNLAHPIIQKGTLNITNSTLNASSQDESLITVESSSTINLVNSSLNSLDGYVINNNAPVTLTLDNNSSFESHDTMIHVNDNMTINGGTYSGLEHDYSSLIVVSNGKLTLNSCNITANDVYDSKAIYIENDDSSLEINDSTINAANKAIQCSNRQEVHIIDGTIKGKDDVIYGCTSTMDDGAIYAKSGAFNWGSVTLNGGTIQRNTDYEDDYGYSLINADITMTGGHIIDVHEGGNALSTVGVDISGGTIEAANTAIYRGEGTISGGTIIAGDVAIDEEYLGSELTITGGTIKGERYGLYAHANRLITIGVDDDTIGITSPVIEGGTYGVYIESGDVNFYDGVLKGKTQGRYGEFHELPDGATLYEADSEIEPETNDEILLSYLKATDDFLQVGDNTYNSLNKLFRAETADTLTIDVIKDGSFYSLQTIPEEKTVTLNLNQHMITMSQEIDNYGTLTINDTKKEVNDEEVFVGGFESINNTIIYSEGSVTINGGKFFTNTTAGGILLINIQSSDLTINDGYFEKNNSDSSSDSTLIRLERTSPVEINGGTFKSKYDTAIECRWNDGITVNNGKFDSKLVFDNCEGTIEDAEVITYQNAASGSNLHIKGGTYTRVNDNEFSANNSMFTSSDLTIDDATIIDNKEEAHSTIGWGTNLTMTGGSIKSANISLRDVTFNISGGSIEADVTAIVIDNGGNDIISGGTIIGVESGIDLGNGHLTVGTNDDTVSTTSPVIMGGDYGIIMYDIKDNYGRVVYKDLSIYDGIIKGKIKPVDAYIYGMPDGYVLDESGTQEINGETYKTAVLASTSDFMQVGEHTYNSFKALFDAENDTNITIDLIANGSLFYDSTIPEGINVTLNLNGYTLTTSQPIINNSPLTINDDLVEVNGENKYLGKIVNYSSQSLFEINAPAIINGGNYSVMQKSYSVMFEVADASLTINDGEFSVGDISISIATVIQATSEDAVINLNGGHMSNNVQNDNGQIVNNDTYAPISVNITGGLYEGTYGLFRNTNLVMTGGKIRAEWMAIDNGYLDLRGGTIASTKPERDSNRGLIEYADVTMSGGTIDAGNIGLSNLDAEISGGTITCAYKCITYVNLTMTGGTVTSEDIGFENVRESTITGGTIEGATYGIYEDAYYNSLTIGSKDSNVNKTSPIIKGGSYGLYKTEGLFYFYDGIFKGQSGAMDAVVDDIEVNTYIVTGSEPIEEDGETNTYVTNYLEESYEFITNKTQNKNYSNINTAIEEANDNDKFELFESASSYDGIEIDKSIEIDMKGNSLVLVNGIIIDEDKEVSIKNTSNTSSKISTLTNHELITNNGTLSINNVALENTNNEIYVITNNNVLTLNTVTLNSKQAIFSSEDTTTTLTNCTVTATKNMIVNYGDITITGGTFTDTNRDTNVLYFLENCEGSTAVISGVTTQGGIYADNSSTVEVHNSTIYGNIYNKNEMTFDTVYFSNEDGTSSSIYNSGSLEYKKGTIDVSGMGDCWNCRSASIMNEGTGVFEDLTMTFENNRYNLLSNIYSNSTTAITLKNSSITVNNSHNYAENLISLEDGQMLVNGVTTSANSSSEANDIDIASIYTKGGDLVVKSSTLETDGLISYGIYMDGGTALVEIGNTITSTGDTAYGVYINGSGATITFGETVVGIDPSTADVDTTSPLISGLGDSEGYGIYRKNGEYNYYDGKFVGSTHARYGAATHCETHWEAREHTETGQPEYCILEYMTNQG